MREDIRFLKRNNPSGFTLIEVMVAVSILAMSLVAFVMIQSNSIEATLRSEHRATAIRMAQKKMEEVLMEYGSKKISSGPEKTGTFEAPHEGYQWKLTIEDFKYDTSFLKALAGGSGDKEQTSGGAMALLPRIGKLIGRAVKEITITVTWVEAEKKKEYRITTHLVNFGGSQGVSL